MANGEGVSWEPSENRSTGAPLSWTSLFQRPTDPMDIGDNGSIPPGFPSTAAVSGPRSEVRQADASQGATGPLTLGNTGQPLCSLTPGDDLHGSPGGIHQQAFMALPLPSSVAPTESTGNSLQGWPRASSTGTTLGDITTGSTGGEAMTAATTAAATTAGLLKTAQRAVSASIVPAPRNKCVSPEPHLSPGGFPMQDFSASDTLAFGPTKALLHASGVAVTDHLAYESDANGHVEVSVAIRGDFSA